MEDAEGEGRMVDVRCMHTQEKTQWSFTWDVRKGRMGDVRIVRGMVGTALGGRRAGRCRRDRRAN